MKVCVKIRLFSCKFGVVSILSKLKSGVIKLEYTSWIIEIAACILGLCLVVVAVH